MMSVEQAVSEFEHARATFKENWRVLYEDMGPEKLDVWGINIKPLLKQQKRLILLLGSEIQPLDNLNCAREMLKLNEVYDTYCPEGKIPRNIQCNVLSAKKLQDKMNKTCEMLLRKARRKEAQEMKPTSANETQDTIIQEGTPTPPPSDVSME